MTGGGHVGDDAELHALGALGDLEARAVERHAASCGACAARLADARDAIVALAATLPAGAPSPALGERLRASAALPARRRVPPAALRSGAIAAVVALAFAGIGREALVANERLADDDRALDAVLHSHFTHVTMTPAGTARVAAKVLFARDGSWFYFVAEREPDALRAVARTPDGDVLLGDLAGSGSSVSLLVRPAPRALDVRLVRVRDGVTVDTATIAVRPGPPSSP